MQNAVERLVGVIRMQGAQTQMPGFRERDRVLHRLSRAHLADHDHIGRLPQHIFQRDFERLGIDADFALRDDTAFVLMNIFDGVFDRDNVPFRVAIAMADLLPYFPPSISMAKVMRF